MAWFSRNRWQLDGGAYGGVMKASLARFTGGALMLVISGVVEPLAAQQPASSQPASPQQSVPDTQNSTLPPIELPDSPGTTTTKQENHPPATAPSQSQPQPSGTAAAPAVQVSGSAASKPAGVAIAPPKQRQIRSWLIKFGFIAGAGAALGAVAALSAASPGHVPNSPGH